MHLYELSLAEKLQWLIDHKTRPDGKQVDWEDVAKDLKGKVSRTYLYLLLKGERKNPSHEVMEQLADYFGVTVLFFSKDPKTWVPPTVRPENLQIALRAHGKLDEEAKEALDELLEDTLAEMAAYRAQRRR